MRGCLRRVAHGAAIPYGYTILTAASGGMLIRSHGPPTLGAGLLFVLGAALGFATVALAGGQVAEPDERPPAVVGAMSACAAAAGVIVASALAPAVPGAVAFAAVAYATTLTYLTVEAAQLWAFGHRVR